MEALGLAGGSPGHWASDLMASALWATIQRPGHDLGLVIFRVGFGQGPVAEIGAAPVIPVDSWYPLPQNRSSDSPPKLWFSQQVLWSAASAPGELLQCTFSGPTPELQSQRLSGDPHQTLLRVLTSRKAENYSQRGDRFPSLPFTPPPKNSCTSSLL